MIAGVFLPALYGKRFFGSCLLLRDYYRSSYKLLLCGGVCFLGLTLNNGLLATDKLLLGPEVDLFTWRFGIALIAMMVLLYGIIWNVDRGAAVWISCCWALYRWLH